MKRMRIENITEHKPSRFQQEGVVAGLVYMLECNYATLDDLELRSRVSESSRRRQRSICASGLHALQQCASEAMEAALAMRCGRVQRALRVPTSIEIGSDMPNEGARTVVVRFGTVSIHGNQFPTTKDGQPQWSGLAILQTPTHTEVVYSGEHTDREIMAAQVMRAMMFMLARAPYVGAVRKDLESFGARQQGDDGGLFLPTSTMTELTRTR